MLRVDAVKPAASLLWSGPGEQDRGMTRDTPNTLNSVISTPVISDGYVYGIVLLYVWQPALRISIPSRERR